MTNAPPYSINSEESVVGSIMCDPEAKGKIGFLSSDDFYNAKYRELFLLLDGMLDKGIAVDPITVEPHAAEIGIDFSALIDMANNAIPSNVVAHADIVKDMSDRRKLIASAHELIDKAANKRVETLKTLSDMSDSIDSMVIGKALGDTRTIDELISSSVARMQQSGSGAASGLKTGIPEIDDSLGYKHLAFGEITVIGGLSKNGKTLLANTITARMELPDNWVGHIFSIEMPEDAMFNAVISAKTGLPANFYDRQDFYQQHFSGDHENMVARWGHAAQELNSGDKFTIDGKDDVDADYIVHQLRKQAALARAKGKVLKYAMIDHFHRMNFKDGGESMTYKMRDSARKLKNIAKELGIAIVVLAQLNNKSKDKQPDSFDILDTSALRHELQVFIGVKMYRQNGNTYFGIFTDSHRYADIQTKFEPSYVKLVGGVMRSLSEGEYFTPQEEE